MCGGVLCMYESVCVGIYVYMDVSVYVYMDVCV